MPRFDHSRTKTSTSNKWTRKVLPQRFFDGRNTNQKTETWDSIEDMWINFK